MERIEYRGVRDRTGWDHGPWDDEPDKIQWQDRATGLPCLIVRNELMGALCGYVGVPEGHPAYGKGYDELDALDVHGGLTFADACSVGPEAKSICHVPAPGESDRVWWLGFDCGHYHDLHPLRSMRLPARYAMEQAYRDVAYVTAQCELLAAQLKAQMP